VDYWVWGKSAMREKLRTIFLIAALAGISLTCPTQILAEEGTSASSQFPKLADPVKGARISSGYGWRIHPILDVRKFHYGIDLAAPRGTPVHAAADGFVEEARLRGANGLYIRIRHGLQLLTSYSHLDRLAVNIRRGAWVTRDQIIGFVGTTGLATGPHLYFEVYVHGEKVDPENPAPRATKQGKAKDSTTQANRVE
jgi:murein DD-endopeptidase MepM/ murein hydrolase activator NlpD